MENLDSQVDVTETQSVKVVKKATKFTLLTFQMKPAEHKVEAEIILYDADNKPLGKPKWILLNSDMSKPDRWDLLVDEEAIVEQVKNTIQGLSFG